MPRPRTKDNHLPKRVYRTTSGAYAYYPPGGGSITIAGKKATLGQIEEAYQKAVQSCKVNSLQHAIDVYKQTEGYERLSQATRDDYEQCEAIPLKTFGNIDITHLRAQHIRQYMDERGKSSKVRANRELAFMSNVFAASYERGMLKMNPCKGVKKFQELPRKHYVEDADFQAMYDICPPPLQAAMEIGYCTGLRITDILDLKWSQVDQGINVTLSKTGVELEKEITPRLRKALDFAKTLPGPSSFYVIHNRRGQRYTKNGFSAMWKRHAARIDNKFQFRDIRKKAITDFEGETKKFSGHKTDQMAARYKVKPVKSPSH